MQDRYQFRRNQTQRLIDAASEERAVAHLVSQIDTREAIIPLYRRRLISAFHLCGLQA